MDERIFEGFEGISDEVKQRAMAATSPEEIMQIARDEGLELTDEQLEGIAGGGDWTCSDHVCVNRLPGDEREDIDEALVSEAFKTGEDLGDDAE